MESDECNINKLIYHLTMPFGVILLNKSLKKEYILDCYRKDFVEEKLLLNLLKKSVIVSSLRCWIPDILCYVHESSITSAVFEFCLRYPGKFRKTLLIQLAHMWLTKSQLLVLNDLLETPEAFCKLLVLYTEDEDCSAEEFLAFLNRNDKFIHQVDYNKLLKLHDNFITAEKLNILEHFVNPPME